MLEDWMSHRVAVRGAAFASSAVLVLASFLTPSAWAQNARDTTAGVALFDEAEALMAKNQVASACPKYRESHQVDPQLGTLVHLADCLERNGQIASAWAHWRDAIEFAQKRGDSREKLARARAAALEPKLPRLSIKVTTPDLEGLEIRRDGAPIDRAVWGSALPIDPGKHVFEARAHGKTQWTQTIEVGAGAVTLNLSVPVLQDMPQAPGGAERSPRSAPNSSAAQVADQGPSDAGKGQRLTAWVVGGVGVAALGAGTYFTLQRGRHLSDRDKVCPTETNCTQADVTKNNDLTDKAKTATTLSYVGFGAGGALLATAVVVYLTAPHEPARTTGYLVVPWVAQSGGGVQMQGMW